MKFWEKMKNKKDSEKTTAEQADSVPEVALDILAVWRVEADTLERISDFLFVFFVAVVGAHEILSHLCTLTLQLLSMGHLRLRMDELLLVFLQHLHVKKQI